MGELQDPPDSAVLAEAAAQVVADGFESYMDRFRSVTREARTYFARRDWSAVPRAAKRRLDLYGGCVVQTVGAAREVLGPRAGDHATWVRVRDAFRRGPVAWSEGELAQTFFNSVVRRIFQSAGVDPQVEFVDPQTSPPRYRAPWSFTVVTENAGDLTDLFRRALGAADLDARWDDLEGDAARVAAALAKETPPDAVETVELVAAPFYRGRAAYLAGQIHTRGGRLPLLLALQNPGGGAVLDAALFTEDEFSIVFSFAHTYFFVDVDRPKELIDFLSSMLPVKPIPDLWNAIGFHRHGKTELYRWLIHHLATTHDRFRAARGQRGLVMVVFTLPGLDIIFKVIRDRFPPPKTVTHEEVREKYRLVFRHDRAGRLVDAQEFELLEFDEERFEPELLDELRTSASESVTYRDRKVIFRHVYTERRLIPLDLFLLDAPPDAAHEAVLDYGQVMRDLAATNIFPGDMLLKNFGVSRHGRIIFYDYDELCLLTDCKFRDLPAASTTEEEVAGEPWYFVGEHDIFPEEFRAFLGLRHDLLEAFLAAHGELLEPAFWRHMQDLHREGVVPDIYPYPTHRRLRLMERRPGSS